MCPHHQEAELPWDRGQPWPVRIPPEEEGVKHVLPPAGRGCVTHLLPSPHPALIGLTASPSSEPEDGVPDTDGRWWWQEPDTNMSVEPLEPCWAPGARPALSSRSAPAPLVSTGCFIKVQPSGYKIHRADGRVSGSRKTRYANAVLTDALKNSQKLLGLWSHCGMSHFFLTLCIWPRTKDPTLISVGTQGLLRGMCMGEKGLPDPAPHGCS